MTTSIRPYEIRTYWSLTLDPVHIGTGGFRLGRVDNAIVREPGTNLPKIPGSSIAGAARAYTAMAIQSAYPTDPNKKKYLRPGKAERTQKPDGSEEEKVVLYHSCAGKGVEDGEGHCGQPDCEVCIPYGFSRGEARSSFQGLAQFCDARILFFPVHSMLGPVWITSPSVLTDFRDVVRDQGISLTIQNELNDGADSIQTAISDTVNSLNLGWILLPNKAQRAPIVGAVPNLPANIAERIVLVPDRLFSRIVNDNLEVRTSVAISPETGAAENGALYTYEAIPRATVVWFDVVYNKPEYFRLNGDTLIQHGKSDGQGWIWVKDNVEKGLAYFEALGIGGMNTRGMGRFRILNLDGLAGAEPTGGAA